MRQMRFDASPLRHVSSLGFNDARQGAMMSGRTSEHDVVVIVYWAALRKWFPRIISSEICAGQLRASNTPFSAARLNHLCAAT